MTASITIEDETATNIKIIVHSDVGFANSLRRILLSETPSLAFDYVEVTENTTIFQDEMIAHRIGLIPLYSSEDLIFPEDCNCENICEKCSIVFSLDSRRDQEQTYNLTGSDFKYIPHEISQSNDISDNETGYKNTPKVEILNSVICKLTPEQRLSLRGIIRKGRTGHAKYSPVTAVEFTYDPNNAKRHTNLWTENSHTVAETWPEIHQPVEIDHSDVDSVFMNIEVVEGKGKPREILAQALNVYKKKMENIRDSLLYNKKKKLEEEESNFF